MLAIAEMVVEGRGPGAEDGRPKAEDGFIDSRQEQNFGATRGRRAGRMGRMMVFLGPSLRAGPGEAGQHGHSIEVHERSCG